MTPRLLVLVRLVALVCALFWTPLLLAPPAHAAWAGRVGFVVDGHTIGTLRPAGYTEQVVCIDSLKDLPASATAGVPLVAADLAHLLTSHGQSTDPVTAAAVASIVKERLDSEFGAFAGFVARLDGPTRAAIAARVGVLKAEMTALRGPYRLTGELVASGARGEVTGLAVAAAGGGRLAGPRITLTLSGATFEGGSATRELTAASTPQGVAWASALAGEVTLQVNSSADLPGTTVLVHPAARAGDQRMVSAGPRARASGLSTTAQVGFTPQYSSQVASAVVTSGAMFDDAVTVGRAEPGGTLPVTLTVYGPFASRPAPAEQPPADAPVHERLQARLTVAEDGSAHGTFRGERPLVEPGHYVAVEANAAGGLTRAASGSFGRPSETTTVIALPVVATQASAQTSEVGATLSDTVTVTGVAALHALVPQAQVTLTGHARGPVAPQGGSCAGLDYASAPVVAEIAPTRLTADGSLSGLGAFTSRTPGCHSYGERLVVTLGERTLGVVEHPVGLASQSVLVRAPEPAATPTPATVTPLAAPAAPRTYIVSGLPDDPLGPAVGLLALAGLLGAAATVARRRGQR